MKKLLYSIATLAVLCFAAGCQREVDIDPVKGELVETEFVVTLDDATVTKAAINNDAANIDKLIVAAFKKNDGTYLPDLNETNGNFTISPVENNSSNQKQFSVQAKLVRNFQYTIAFFAMHDGAPYTLGTDGSITMAAGATNDETLDAFYKAEDITLDPDTPSSLSKSITLTRPLAQINVLSDPADWAAATTSGITTGLQSSISIAKAPNKLNLYDGAISGETTLEFTQTAIPEGTINVAAANATAVNAHYVAMAYVLSSDTASPVDVTFAVPAVGTDFTGFTRVVENVPNRRNYRTNLHGDLFTTSGNFTVVIDPNFGGNDNQDINIPQPTVSPLGSIPTGISTANPGIQQPTIDTGNNVTTNLADGKLFFGIDTNSDGAITYSSSDHNVGTIDNDGVFTPVGPGTTNITVTQAAGTQTKAIGDPLAEITIVYHVTVEATEYTVTVSGTPANGTVEIKNEAGDAEFTQGISGTKFTVVATPATNYNLGSLVVADTDGNLEASEGKYTIRTSNVTVTATFVAMGQVATPVISPDGGYYTAGEKATITCSEDGAAIYYTLDGTEPSATSTLYEGPIDLTNGTIKAIAVKANMINSAVAEATFTAKLATTIDIVTPQDLTYGQTITLTPVLKVGTTPITEGVTFSYTESNNNAIVVNASGVVEPQVGHIDTNPTVTITATAVPDAYLAPDPAVVTINLLRAASTITWNSGDLAVTVGESLDLSGKYTKTGSAGAVTFAIASGSDKAHIDGNTLVADAAGEVTVNATVAENACYASATTATAKTITINDAAPTKYDVIVDNATVNGTVSADKAEAAEGETVTLTITPADYYELDVLTVEDENSQAVTVTNNQFAMPVGGVTVTATFKKLKYAITISNMTNGTVAVDETPAKWGDTVILTVTPDSGYQLVENSLTVTSGVTDLTDMTGGEWCFTMPKNAVTVSAEFEAVPPTGLSLPFNESFSSFDGTMGWSGNGIANGSTVTPDNDGWDFTKPYGADGAAKFGTSTVGGAATTPAINHSGNATLTFKSGSWSGDATTLNVSVSSGHIESTSGQTITSVTIPSGDWGKVRVYLKGVEAGFKVTFASSTDSKGRFFLDEVKIVEGLVEPVKYSINCATVQGGTIEADVNEAEENDIVTLTATPATHYLFGSWSVNNGAVTVTDNKFAMPAENVTVSATFTEAQQYSISVASGIEHGSVAISGNITQAYEGDEVIVVPTPESDSYQLKSLTYTKGSDAAVAITKTGNDYKFIMPNGAVEINAEFESKSNTTSYTKVTSTPSDWSGTYILVYEESSTSGRVCTAGVDAASNYVSATIASGVISSNDLSNYEVEIATYSTGYSIKALGGTNANKYLEGQGSSSNGTSFATSPSKVTTLELSDGIVILTNYTNIFAYNSTSNNYRWRFFKSTTAASNGYYKPALYKKN